MKSYHLYFYIIKITLLIIIALISLKIIPVKNKLYTLIEFVFKLSFGLFIIIFFTINNNLNINQEDKVLIILCGFILILLIDYIHIIDILTNNHIKNNHNKILINS